ncbi:MAG: FAD-dependent oxidoreductase [Aristaeellaceae bacterium]
MERASLWQRTVSLPEYPPLAGDERTEVCVIGGGMAGLLTAYLLRERGVSVIVLEADRIASGQTGRTTAKITGQHELIYDRLIRQQGEDRAAQYARANAGAIAEYARITEKKRIRCDFAPREAYLYSREESTPLEKEAEAARRLGLDAAFVRETELPFPIAGAVRLGAQAQFHPLRFLQGIADELRIHEKTRVLTVEGQQVHTERGTVTAEHIVFATHFPFINVPGLYFMRMHQERSYVLALQSPWLPKRGMYLGTDADGLSLREAEGLLLLGGGAHRTGENGEGGCYDFLTDQAQGLLPGCREMGRWSAQDCMTLDGVPYIGQYARSEPEWYVATGFGKWGMTGAMVSAMLLTPLICGKAPDWAEVFSPQRFRLSESAQALANETGHALRGLTRELFSLPDETLSALQPGHGGIVAYEGRKAGVYRAEDGAVYQVDPRCPHLGCELTWNPDERSWDCPCHGSRFHYDGSLLDNPAQEHLAHSKRALP